MGTEPSPATLEERTHHAVARILRVGLSVAGSLFALGILVRLARGERSADVIRLFDRWYAGELGNALLALGVVVLAATPLVRAVALVGLWTRQKDYRYAAAAAFVVAMLGVAIAVGKG